MFYILASSPSHGMYPGVSSYGMEAGPPRFLYMKDECFLMTDWCDIDISLIMKNSKSVTFTSEEVSGGDGKRKILDQYLTSGIVSTRSIQRFKRYPILKTFTVMILSFWTDMPGQTVQTQIRLLLEEQSDQSLHCLPFRLHRFDSLLYGRDM